VSGSGKRAGRKTSTALRPDSTGKLRRCTDKRKVIVEFWLCLAAAFTVIRRLTQQSPQPLPLAHPAKHPSAALTINCRSL
jgi:hypothetical protein